jgi:hypothetical protein
MGGQFINREGEAPAEPVTLWFGRSLTFPFEGWFGKVEGNLLSLDLSYSVCIRRHQPKHAN